MGSYTEFYFNVKLKSDTPDEVIEILRYMLDTELTATYPEVIRDHQLFHCDRWRFMLASGCTGISTPVKSVLVAQVEMKWALFVHSAFKNYDDEVEHFVHWIAPHIDAGDGDFLGFYRNQDDNLLWLIKLWRNEPLIEVVDDHRRDAFARTLTAKGKLEQWSECTPGWVTQLHREPTGQWFWLDEADRCELADKVPQFALDAEGEFITIYKTEPIEKPWEFFNPQL